MKDSCIKAGAQVCVNYTLPKIGTIVGSGNIKLQFYQNGSPTSYSITSSGTLAPSGTYCFTIDPNQLPCSTGQGGYDVVATGNFSITTGTLTTPVVVTSPDPAGSAPNVEGIKAGMNNDLVCCHTTNDACDQTSATIIKANNGCCYSIYISNKYDTGYFSGLTIETGLLNIDNVSQGNVWGGITYQSPHSISFGGTTPTIYMPVDSVGSNGFLLANICLSGIGSDTLKLKWIAPSQHLDTVCEKDIPIIGCGVPVDTNCAAIINQTAVCNNGVVTMQFQVVNRGSFTMRAITLYSTDPDVKPVDPFVPIADLLPGATSPVYSVPLIVKNNATSGCFFFAACDMHAKPGTGGKFPGNCCMDSIKYCVAIPSCNGCDAVTITSVKTDPKNCCYTLTLINNYYSSDIKCLRFNGEAGTQFAIMSGWNIQSPVTASQITMCAPGGKVSTGTSLNFASFCITGNSTPPYKISVDFLGDSGQVICTKELSFDTCTLVKPTCATVVNDSLYCDGSRTQFSFYVKNYSPFVLYQFDLHLSDTNIKLDKNVIVPNPPVAVGATSGPYTVTVDSAVAGAANFCVYLSGHNNIYIPDSVAATECCTDSMDAACMPMMNCASGETCCQFSKLQIPNGITPNGDGKDDKYVIGNSAICTNIDMVVYNRWGNIVYKQDHYLNNWAGTNTDGQQLPKGTYYVLLKLATGDKKTYFVDIR